MEPWSVWKLRPTHSAANHFERNLSRTQFGGPKPKPTWFLCWFWRGLHSKKSISFLLWLRARRRSCLKSFSGCKPILVQLVQTSKHEEEQMLTSFAATWKELNWILLLSASFENSLGCFSPFAGRTTTHSHSLGSVWCREPAIDFVSGQFAVELSEGLVSKLAGSRRLVPVGGWPARRQGPRSPASSQRVYSHFLLRLDSFAQGWLRVCWIVGSSTARLRAFSRTSLAFLSALPGAILQLASFSIRKPAPKSKPALKLSLLALRARDSNNRAWLAAQKVLTWYHLGILSQRVCHRLPIQF